MKRFLLPLTFMSVSTFLLTGCNTPESSSLPDVVIPSFHPQKFILPNGLTLIVEEDHRSPVVSIQTWCRAGSITEGEFLGSGVSHILEHMLFKGTSRRGNSEIAQTIQSIGGYTNAYTSFDRTVYYIDAPSAGWETALDVLIDAVFHSTLPAEEYQKEMEVVRREFAMGFDDPGRTLQKILFSTAYLTHPYHYPVIGHLDNFNRLTRDDVLKYYRQHYVPNNITVVVAGAVNAEAVRTLLESMTRDIQRAPLPDVFIPAEPRQLGPRHHHEAFPTDAARFYLAWPIPGITHPDLYALDVMAILAGQGKSSRLHQHLVEKQPLLRQAAAFSYTPADSGLWAAYGVMHPESSANRDEVIQAILDELKRFKTEKVSPAELAKAKRMVLTSHIADMTTVSGKARTLGSDWFIARDLTFSESYLRGLRDVTAEDILRVARTYLIDSTLNVAGIHPPSTSSDTSPITSSTSAPRLPLVETLSNGAPLIRVDDPSLPLLTVSAVMRGGLLMETPEKAGISHLYAQMLKKGTRSLSASALADRIESIGGSFSVESGNHSIAVSLTVLSTDYAEAISILSEVILHSSFDSEELGKEQRNQLSDLRLEKDQPMRIARDHLRAALFQSHPYARNTLGSEDTITQIQRDDLLSFQKQVWNAEQVVFSLAGQIPSTAVATLEKAFPASSFFPVQERASHAPSFAGQGQTLHIPTDKKQAVVQIGFPGLTIESDDRVAMDLIDEALSDLASRLFLRIREQQSLAYFVGSAQLVGLDPGYFMFYAGTRPDTSLKVRDEILDEVALLVQSGLDPEEFKRAKAKLAGKRLLENQSASQQAFKASLNVLYGLGAEFEEHYQNQLEALTLEDVHAAAKKYFSNPHFVCVILQPETKP